MAHTLASILFETIASYLKHLHPSSISCLNLPLAPPLPSPGVLTASTQILPIFGIYSAYPHGRARIAGTNLEACGNRHILGFEQFIPNTGIR
jgi:hypothetical protein